MCDPSKNDASKSASRVEQRVDFAAQHPRQIGIFCPITFRAGIAERVRIVSAPVLLSDDVLNVESQEVGLVFVKAAVFTATACPLPDEGPERGIHHSPGELVRSWRAFDFRMATKVSK